MNPIRDIFYILFSIKKWFSVSFLVIPMILIFNFSSQFFSQVILQFPNGGANGALFSGTAGTVGAIYQWPNVGTEGAVTIKAKIEIISITGGATLTTIDGASTTADWEPQITGPTTTNGNSWGIKFQVRFYDAADDSPYNVSSLRAQGIDIDGGGTGSALREYNTFDTPDSYTLENPTELTASTVTGGTKFTSSASSYSGISISQTQFIASCDFANVNSVSITCGVSAVGGTVSSTNRLHSLNFRNVVVFTEPVTELPVELIHFNASVLRDYSILINWSTATELHNDYFTLERLENLQFYSIVSIINGNGSSSIQHDYQYIDINALQEITYYRLKQTDTDGKFSYSDEISVDNRVHKKEISMRTNLLGIEVNDVYRGVVIVIYEDGTTCKIIQ